MSLQADFPGRKPTGKAGCRIFRLFGWPSLGSKVVPEVSETDGWDGHLGRCLLWKMDSSVLVVVLKEFGWGWGVEELGISLGF